MQMSEDVQVSFFGRRIAHPGDRLGRRLPSRTAQLRP
jgi:hypothetical protein